MIRMVVYSLILSSLFVGKMKELFMLISPIIVLD